MNRSALNDESLEKLSKFAPNHVCWLITTPFGFVSNILVIVTIVSSKFLHTKSQFLILSHSATEVTLSLALFITGSSRLIAYQYSMPETSNQLECILKQTPMDFGARAVSRFTLALAIDRLLFILKPKFHKSVQTLSYVLMVNVVCWGSTFLVSAYAFAEYDETKLFPVCTLVTSFHRSYVRYVAIDGSVNRVGVVIINLTAGFLLWRHYKAACLCRGTRRSEWRKQMDLNTFFALAVVAAIYILVAIMTLTAIAAKFFTLEFLNWVPMISVLVSQLRATSNVFVYLYFIPSFRKAFKLLVDGKQRRRTKQQPFDMKLLVEQPKTLNLDVAKLEPFITLNNVDF